MGLRVLILSALLACGTAEAVTLHYSLTRAKDSAATDCNWSTARGSIRAPADLDTGDEADGDCSSDSGGVFFDNGSGVQAREFKCRSLRIDRSVRFVDDGGQPLIIRVTGDARISANLSVDGFPGEWTDSDTSAGGAPGPAGYAGGEILFGPSNGQSPGAGAGRANPITSGNVDVSCGGGGGSGASFGDLTLGAAGNDALSEFVGCDSQGADAPVALPALGEDNFSVGPLHGGPGGGAGASGWISLVTEKYGAAGGGGGGVVHLVVGGDLTITGTISANGGAGGDTTTLGGGGGGGAGGLIWLQVGGKLTQKGTVRALGGRGGRVNSTASFRGGAGGAGGVGRVRMDVAAGNFSGRDSTPRAQIAPSTAGRNSIPFDTNLCTAQSLAVDTLGVRNRVTGFSLSQTLNAGDSINVSVEESDDGQTWSNLVPIADVDQLTKRYLRFQVQLQAAASSATPVLSGIRVEYDILEKSDEEFKSSVSCGTTAEHNGPDPGAFLLTLLTGLLGALATRRSSSRLRCRRPATDKCSFRVRP